MLLSRLRCRAMRELQFGHLGAALLANAAAAAFSGSMAGEPLLAVLLGRCEKMLRVNASRGLD